MRHYRGRQAIRLIGFKLITTAPSWLRTSIRLRTMPSCGRERERRRLDHDRRAPAARDERLQRLAREREAQRVANGRSHVRDGVGRRRGLQNDGVVVSGQDDEPRPGQQWDSPHRRDRLRSGSENV